MAIAGPFSGDRRPGDAQHPREPRAAPEARQARRRRPTHSLEEAAGLPAAEADRILALDAALEKLDALNPRHARVVECRFFGGMTIEETAAVLEVSGATVERDWALLRVWLGRELAQAT